MGSHSTADDDAFFAAEFRTNHRCVTRPDLQRADERFNHRATLNLMIILSNDPVLAGDVRMREQRHQPISGRSMGFQPMKIFGCRNRLVAHATDDCFPLLLRDAIVDEGHPDASHLGFLIVQNQFAIRRAEFTDQGGFDIFACA